MWEEIESPKVLYSVHKSSDLISSMSSSKNLRGLSEAGKLSFEAIAGSRPVVWDSW